MATQDGPVAKYAKERDHRVPKAIEAGDLTQSDGELLREFLDAMDPNRLDVDPGDIGTKSASTLRIYGKNLRLIAKAGDEPLGELDASGINRVMSDWRGDLKDNTIQQRQAAARVFYRYHDHLGVDPELITIVKNEKQHVDPRDIFDREEWEAIREQFDNSRDRAAFDLMLYTGQRIRAILTLRVRDIDLGEGRFYLNTDAAGLKGAKGKRPLLLAKDSIADWLEDHPAGHDPDAYLFTKKPGANSGNPTEAVHYSTLYRALRKAVEDAGVDRAGDRCNPHNLRHTFVRWAYIRRGMDVQTIKFMGGWNSDSTTFEETYFNILDEEHSKKAEVAAGVISEEEAVEDMVPEVCPICDHTLEVGAKACPGCGSVLTPDAKDAKEGIEAEIKKRKERADTLEEYKDVDSIAQAVDDDPVFAANLMKKLEEFAER